MPVMTAKPVTEQLADEIIERLDESYDLIYVDYRDELTDEQVNLIVRGGDDYWQDENSEWVDDSRYEGSKYVIEELVREVARDWDLIAADDLIRELRADADEYDRVRFEIEERDSGDWENRLVRQTPKVLLRINVLDEDHGYSFEEVKARRVLKDVGLRATRANAENMERTLAECSPEYSVLMGYWIVGADVSDIYKLPLDPETDVEIENPYLYLGNPFAGSGFISERPFEGTVRVKRDELRTDKDAFGYSVNEVYGGLRPSDFECKIRARKEDE